MEKQEKKVLKKPGRIKRFLNKIVKTLVLAYALQQTAYFGNRLYHELRPSPVRADFRKEFGFPLRGFSEDVEERGTTLSYLFDVINTERAEMPFSLNGLCIESGNPLKQSFIAHMGHTIGSSYSGFYNPLVDDIVLSTGSGMALHHEIKHAKTFEILKKYPELKKRWIELARDSQGKSLYYSIGEQICSKFRGLENLVGKEKKNTRVNRRLGFVSDYARTNVYEDIAETCAQAEDEGILCVVSSHLGSALYGDELDSNNGKNQILADKVKLAQEYGLIPREFFEFVGIKNFYYQLWDGFGSVNREKAKKFLEESAKFLEKKPLMYEVAIHNARGRVFENIESSREYTLLAIQEYKKALESRFKYSWDYHIILSHLKDLYASLGEEKMRELYKKAEQLSWKGFEAREIDSIMKTDEFLRNNRLIGGKK